jgi:hypothetical protein
LWGSERLRSYFNRADSGKLSLVHSCEPKKFCNSKLRPSRIRKNSGFVTRRERTTSEKPAAEAQSFAEAAGPDFNTTDELTDTAIAKPLREELRDSACHRFATVLGPGADSYHDSHIHLDTLERNHGYRICQWDVREPPLVTQNTSADVPLPIPRPVIVCRQYEKSRSC